MIEQENNIINIYEYNNYRNYLKNLYAYLKKTKAHFSFRYFSKMAGFSSPNFLKLVMDGKRNLSQDSIEKFCKAFKLNNEEAKFFRILVNFNQADTQEEKNYYAEQLFHSKHYRKIYPLKQSHFDLFTLWYAIPIREMIALSNFKEDHDWIAKQFIPHIPKDNVKKALNLLLKLELIKRDESGRLIQTNEIIETSDEVFSLAIANYHKEMLEKSKEAINLFDAKDREISAAVIPADKETFKKIKLLIQKFRKELLAIASNNKDANGIYQVNFQAFPLAKL